MKRIISIILVAVMLTSLSACGTSTAQQEGNPGQTAPDEELERAVEYGIVSANELENMTETITYGGFCKLLSKVVAMRGEKYVPLWEEAAESALNSDEPMQRDDAILTMFEASIVMGIDRDECVISDWESDSTVEDWWEGATWDYELFPNWEEPYVDGFDGNTDYNIFYHAAWHFEGTPSVVSLLLPFEPEEGMIYGFGRDVSFEDAVRALTRLVESNAKFTAEDAVYIPVTEVGAYDSSIITDTLLSAESTLPDCSQEQLPSTWKGFGLSSCKDGEHIYRHFKKSDIQFLHENGFNFVRLFFGFDTLRFPDYPEDGRLVNENELLELDRLIAWCMEYDVHIQISMNTYLNESGDCKVDAPHSMPENDAEWAIISDYWTMLARRYAGIPSRNLSFDLGNESQPEDDKPAYQAESLGRMVSSIRKAGGERVLVYSFQGNPDTEWMKVTASLGLAVGCHPYYPENISTGDPGSGGGDYFEPCWPMPVLPAWQIATRNEPLTLRGEISGAEVSVHVGKSGLNARLEVMADGKTVANLDMPEGTPDENDEYIYGEDMLTFTLPEDIEEAQIWVRDEDAHIDTVIVNGSAGRTAIVFSSDEEGDGNPLPVVVCEDGSYHNTKNTIVTADDIYENAIKPYREIAEEHNVGFMVNEFGVFANGTWDISVVTAYHDTMMDLFAEKNLSWCFCELYNGTTHLLLRESSQSQWANATVKSAGLDPGDGPCFVVQEMLESFRRHTAD